MSKQFCGQDSATQGVGIPATVLSDGLSLKKTDGAMYIGVAGPFLWAFTSGRVGAALDAGVHRQRPQRTTYGLQCGKKQERNSDKAES
jgi:hypothetical protein